MSSKRKNSITVPVKSIFDHHGGQKEIVNTTVELRFTPTSGALVFTDIGPVVGEDRVIPLEKITWRQYKTHGDEIGLDIRDEYGRLDIKISKHEGDDFVAQFKELLEPIYQKTKERLAAESASSSKPSPTKSVNPLNPVRAQSIYSVGQRQVAAATNKIDWNAKMKNPNPPPPTNGTRATYHSVRSQGDQRPQITRRGNTIDTDERPTPNPFSKFSVPANSQAERNTPGPQKLFNRTPLKPPITPPAGLLSKTYAPKHAPPLALPRSIVSPQSKPSAPKYQPTITNALRPYTSSTANMGGFRNVGNSCYMGATLRAMMSVKSFIADLGHQRLMNISSIPEDSFFHAFLALTDVATDEKSSTSIDPTPVKKKLGQHFQLFSGSQQQDSHEFFIDCIEQIESDLYPHLRVVRAQKIARQVEAEYAHLQKKIGNGTKSNSRKQSTRRNRKITESEDESSTTTTAAQEHDSGPIAGETEDWWSKFAAEVDLLKAETLFCPAKRNFGGVMQTTVTCNTCLHSRDKKEPMRFLSVQVADKDELQAMVESLATIADEEDTDALNHIKSNIKNEASVANLLQLFFLKEVVQLNCERCEGKEATLCRRIVRPPRVLVIQLKRFSQSMVTQRWTKISEPVEISPTIQIQRFTTRDPDNFQKPIPFDKKEYEAFKANRTARLEKMKAKAGKPTSNSKSASSPSKPAGAATTISLFSEGSEPAPKRRKLSDDETSDALNFKQEEELTQKEFDIADDVGEVSLLGMHTEKDQELKGLSHKYGSGLSRVILESEDPTAFADENTAPATNGIKKQSAVSSSPKAIDLATDEVPAEEDEDADYKRAVAESLREEEAAKKRQQEREAKEFAEAMERSKQTEDKEIQEVIELSKQTGLKLVYEPDEYVSQDIMADSSPTRDNYNAIEDQEMDVMDTDTKLDSTENDSPTAPPSPSEQAAAEEWIGQVHPGETSIFPEMGYPDPFKNDEFNTSSELEVTNAALSGECSYRLQSIIHHIGNSPSHGHYVTDVYNDKDKLWMHHDDSVVTKIEEHQSGAYLKERKTKTNAYLLFYVNDKCHPT